MGTNRKLIKVYLIENDEGWNVDKIPARRVRDIKNADVVFLNNFPYDGDPRNTDEYMMASDANIPVAFHQQALWAVFGTIAGEHGPRKRKMTSWAGARRCKNKRGPAYNHISSAKLTEAQVLEIRGSDKSNKELSLLHHVAPCTIRDARNGRSWKHVGGLIPIGLDPPGSIQEQSTPKQDKRRGKKKWATNQERS